MMKRERSSIRKHKSKVSFCNRTGFVCSEIVISGVAMERAGRPAIQETIGHRIENNKDNKKVSEDLLFFWLMGLQRMIQYRLGTPTINQLSKFRTQ